MVNNVFGNSITYKTLESMPEYEGKTITRQDVAKVALDMMNAEDKEKHAAEYLVELQQQMKIRTATLCLIYNATGETIRYVCDHSCSGQNKPSGYPIEIANGQWGAFFQKSGVISGSAGAIVYRGQNNDGVFCDWMTAWSNPWFREVINNKAYTEIREEGHYDKNDHWDYIFNLLQNSNRNHFDKWNGCFSNARIGIDESPIFEAVFAIGED